MKPLLEAVRDKNREKAMEWAWSEHWRTVEELISATSTSQSSQGAFNNSRLLASAGTRNAGIGVGTQAVADQPSQQSLWTCPYCTFLNPADFGMCEMCNLPRYY